MMHPHITSPHCSLKMLTIQSTSCELNNKLHGMSTVEAMSCALKGALAGPDLVAFTPWLGIHDAAIEAR
jgi:hypothetical protein